MDGKNPFYSYTGYYSPGEIYPLELEVVATQETPNVILIAKMQEVNIQIKAILDRSEGLQELLEGLVEVQGDEIPSEDFLQAIIKVKLALAIACQDIDNKKREYSLLQHELNHNVSDEGLSWQDWINKRLARDQLGLP